MSSSINLNVFLFLLYCLLASGTITHALKVSHISYLYSELHHYFHYFFVYSVSIVFLLVRVKYLKFYPYVIFALFFVTYLFIYAAVASFFYDVVSMTHYLGHLLRNFYPLLFIPLLATARDLDFSAVSNTIHALHKPIIAFCILILGFYIYQYFVRGVYFGLGISILSLPFAVSLFHKRFLTASLILIFAFVAGKRTYFLSLFIPFLIIFLLRASMWQKIVCAVVGYAGVTLCLIIFSGSSLGKRFFDFERFLSNPDFLFSGRLIEMKHLVIGYLNDFYLLLGSGFSFHYELQHAIGYTTSSVHFTPLNFISIYGLFNTILIYSLLTYVFWRLVKKYRDSKDFLLFISVMIFSIEVINSFGIYNLTQSYVFWFFTSLGLARIFSLGSSAGHSNVRH